MYSDGKLGAVEDALVRGVLDTFQFESDYARNQYLDASNRPRERRGADSGLGAGLCRESCPELCLAGA